MQSVSYTDIRHSVLDSFYSNLVSKPETDLTYDKALDYVTYSFEVGFSDVEMFVIDFVVYVLCSDFKVSEELSLILERKLLTITPLSTYFSKVLVYLFFKISVKTIRILNSIKIKSLR